MILKRLALALLVCSVISTSAFADSKSVEVKVNYDSNAINKTIAQTEKLMREIKDPAKLKDITNEYKLQKNYKQKMDTKVKSSIISISSISKTVSMYQGTSASNYQYSSNLAGNYASMNITLTKASASTGYTWNGLSKARWYGSNPVNALSLVNTMDYTATGPVVSISLKGASITKTFSASLFTTDVCANGWQSSNTFTATCCPVVRSHTFTSTSACKLSNNSGTDTVYTKIIGTTFF